MGRDFTFKPQNKYKAIRILDENCIDYESYEQSSGNLVITIVDDINDSIIEQLEDIDVG